MATVLDSFGPAHPAAPVVVLYHTQEQAAYTPVVEEEDGPPTMSDDNDDNQQAVQDDDDTALASLGPYLYTAHAAFVALRGRTKHYRRFAR